MMPTWTLITHNGRILLDDVSGLPKMYDADLYPDGPPPGCCCGNTCIECFNGESFGLCVLLSGSPCPQWDNSYCLPFNLFGTDCQAGGFTILECDGYTLPGIQGTWNGTTLCVNISDAFGKHFEWCAQVTCAQLADGVFLPATLGSGGSLFVKATLDTGCPGCGGEGLMSMMAAARTPSKAKCVGKDLTEAIRENGGAGPKIAPNRPQAGPGTELKKLLAKFFINEKQGCGCNKRAAEMDKRGADWCEANIETIVGWLREAAATRRLPFVEFPARAIVRRAISNARKAALVAAEVPATNDGLIVAPLADTKLELLSVNEPTDKQAVSSTGDDVWREQPPMPGVVRDADLGSGDLASGSGDHQSDQ